MTPSDVGFDGKFEIFSHGGKKIIKLARSNNLNFEESKNCNLQLNNTFLWACEELLYRSSSGELFKVHFERL
jgi:hypothetical protein